MEEQYCILAKAVHIKLASFNEHAYESSKIILQDLSTGVELLTKPISDLSGSVVWANDNETLFYTTKDHLDRPFKVSSSRSYTPIRDGCT
jgi:protease II